jgi:hypothetical protein
MTVMATSPWLMAGSTKAPNIMFAFGSTASYITSAAELIWTKAAKQGARSKKRGRKSINAQNVIAVSAHYAIAPSTKGYTQYAQKQALED